MLKFIKKGQVITTKTWLEYLEDEVQRLKAENGYLKDAINHSLDLNERLVEKLEGGDKLD